MENKPATTITAEQFRQELRSLPSTGSITLVMPVGVLTRRVKITSIELHDTVVELQASQGEVLTFPATDTAEIRRIVNSDRDRQFTRYELTFPLGNYFALIVGV